MTLPKLQHLPVRVSALAMGREAPAPLESARWKACSAQATLEDIDGEATSRLVA